MMIDIFVCSGTLPSLSSSRRRTTSWRSSRSLSALTAVARFTKSAFFTSSRSGESKFALQSRKKNRQIISPCTPSSAYLCLQVQVRRLPQGSREFSEGEPVHSEAPPDHPAGQLHRDQGEQLPEEEGGRRRRRAHQGGLLWRQASGGQAWHEAQVREISPVHTASPSILSYLYSNSTNDTCLIVLIEISHNPRK